jgi:adenine deaminase
MDRQLLDVALGKRKADLVVANGQLVNVTSGEIYPGGVAVVGDRIAAIGDIEYTIGAETNVVDAGGNFITPGFVEGHIHPESSTLSMARFAEIALCHGTTSVFTDLHEIGVVGGITAIDAALAEGRRTALKYYFVVPSHIPFAPGLETSGGVFDAPLIANLVEREDAVGLSEVVSIYVALGHDDLLQSIDATRQARKAMVGHGPETKGPAWSAFAATGITNDHESLDLEDVLLRVRNGVYAHIRHNLLVPTLPELIKAVTEHHVNPHFICLVTDDTSPVALTQEGHLDYLVRVALAQGVPFVQAIQMVTINTACSFHAERDIGALAPGRYADINIVTGPDEFRVLSTIAQGTLVAQAGRLVTPLPPEEHAPLMYGTFHLKAPVTAADLAIHAPAGATAANIHVMRTLPWIPLTTGEEVVLPVRNGIIAADPEQDLAHIAVVERHHQTGNIGKAFIGGFGLKRGAIASSVGHDNHNIVVMGVDPRDMALAVARIVELDGGIVLVDGGAVVGEQALPMFGLLTDGDAWSVAAQRARLLDTARDMGCSVPEPFMFLSFITLAGIPQFAVTDKGYIDCLKQAIIDPVLNWVKGCRGVGSRGVGE